MSTKPFIYEVRNPVTGEVIALCPTQRHADLAGRGVLAMGMIDDSIPMRTSTLNDAMPALAVMAKNAKLLLTDEQNVAMVALMEEIIFKTSLAIAITEEVTPRAAAQRAAGLLRDAGLDGDASKIEEMAKRLPLSGSRNATRH